MVFGQLVILSDRVSHLMTSNPDYFPLVDIRQGHFHKSFELLTKFGLWLVVNSECCLWSTGWGLPYSANKQRVLMHGHQGWNVRHGLCHIYMIYVYIWVVYSLCLFCCLFIIVTTQFVALYKPCKPKPSTYDPPPPPTPHPPTPHPPPPPPPPPTTPTPTPPHPTPTTTPWQRSKDQ